MHSDLEQFLQHYSELVLINLWEHTGEASLYMDRLMQDVERTLPVPVLRLRLTEHREWARTHGIYGTPALLAYYRGQPLFRCMGRITFDELLYRLRRLEL